MKKLLIILLAFFSFSTAVFAQEEDQPGGDENIRDKMSEYIQQRLQLNKTEADRFIPIFIRYFREWRVTLRENRGDRLILQQKIIELRLRYRPEFRGVLGDQRGNQVFRHQDTFIKELKQLKNERQNRPMLRRRVNQLRINN